MNTNEIKIEVRNGFERHSFVGKKSSGYYELYKMNDLQYDWLGSLDTDDEHETLPQSIKVEFEADMDYMITEDVNADNSLGFELEAVITIEDIQLVKSYEGFDWQAEKDLVVESLKDLIYENMRSCEEHIVENLLDQEPEQLSPLCVN